MSVVRKLQNGKVIPEQNNDVAFRNFLAEEINKQSKEGKFTSNGEKTLRAQAALWADQATKGLFNKDENGNYKYYSTDNLKNTYSINPKDNAELSVLDLVGNEGQIKPNMFGQLNLKNKAHANTWIADAKVRFDAQQNNTNKESDSQIHPTHQINFGPLDTYLKGVVYNQNQNPGGNDNWGTAWENNISGLPEKQIQQKIAQTQKDYLDWHNSKIAAPEDNMSYSKINNQDELYNVTNKIISGDFTPEDYRKFQDIGSRYGTDFSSLYTPKTKEELDVAALAKTTETEKIASDNYIKELTGKGLSEENAQIIAQNKYKLGTFHDNIPEHVRNYIAKQKGIVWDRPNGTQVVLNPSLQYVPTYSNDPDNNPNTYFTNDNEGGFNYFDKNTLGYNKELFKDPTSSSLARRPLNANFTGYEGFKVTGIPKILSNGENDYTQRLYLEHPTLHTGMTLLKKGDVPGVYQDNKGKEYSGDITGFGEYTADKGNSDFSLNGLPEITQKYKNIPSIKKDDISLEIEDTQDIGNRTVEQTKATLSGLKYIIDHPEEYWDFDTQNKAYLKYTKMIDMLESSGNLTNIREQILSQHSNTVSLPSLGSGRYTTTSRKKGGILKAQMGTAAKRLSPEEYNRLYNPVKASSENSNDPTKQGIRNTIGSIRDMGTADAFSLAGSLASIVPGLGVIGGLTTTVADAIKDKSNGWDRGATLNLGMNLGFTALSAIGFGTVGAGARAAKLAAATAKAAKVAEEAAKVAKIGKVAIEGIEDAAKLEKLAMLVEDGKKLTSFKQIGLTSQEVKELKTLEANGKVLFPELKTATLTKKVPPEFLNKIQKVVAPIVETPAIKAPSLLQREFSGTINAAKHIKAGLPTVGKAVAGVASGAAAIGAGYSAVDVAGKALKGDWGSIQTEDLKNIGFGISGARGYLKTRSMASLAKKINAAEGDAKEMLSIGKNKFKFNSKLTEVEKAEKLATLNKLGKLREKNMLTANKENIAKNVADEETFKNTFKELVDDQKINDNTIKSFMKSDASVIKTNNNAADLGVSEEEFDRASRFAKGKLNYWNNLSLSRKKGGILKAEKGNHLSYDKETSKTYKYDKGYVDFIDNLDDKWFNDHQAEIKQTAGNYKVNNLQHLKYLGTDSKYGNITKLLQSYYETAQNNSVQTGNQSTSTGTGQGVGTGTGTGTTPSKLETVPFSTPPEFISARNRFSFMKDSFNKNDIYNLAGFLGANSATNKAIDLQKKGAYASLASLPFASRQYLRKTSPNQMFFDKQAAGINTMAGRMAGSINDIDKASGIMFTGQDRGQQTREKGFTLDLDLANKTIQQQMESDQKIDQYNNQIYGQNKGMAAKTAGQMFMYDAAGVIGKNQNFQNYLQQLNRSDQIKQQEQKYKDYYALATNPNQQDLYTQMGDLNTQYLKDKSKWDKESKGIIGNEAIQPWEENNIYINYNKKLKLLNKQSEDYQRKLYNSSMAMQMPGNVGYSKKGGSLDLNDRKELLRYQHELKKHDTELEIFYKVILKNNELMYKSLSRIFK